MRRLAAPGLTAALAAALLTALPGTGATVPSLRTATANRGHVVVGFRLGDQAPGRILVATRRTTMPGGRLANGSIRLDERLRAVKTATGYRARARHALAPGVYYVQISGIVLTTDCLPGKPCRQAWSNVLRVRVPRP
jgi:hypothetical protein